MNEQTPTQANPTLPSVQSGQAGQPANTAPKKPDGSVAAYKAAMRLPMNENVLYAYKAEPRVSIVHDILDEGQIVNLAAVWNLGKTPLLQQLGISVAAGIPFLEHKTSPRPVIVLDAESPHDDYESSAKRIAEQFGIELRGLANFRPILQHGPNTDPMVRLFRDALLVAERTRNFIRALLELQPNALLILDPFLAVLPFHSKEDANTVEIMRFLRQLTAQFPHASILGTFHLRKMIERNQDQQEHQSGETLLKTPRIWFEEVAGSVKISAHADVRLGMAAYQDTDEEFLILRGFRRGKEHLVTAIEKQQNDHGEYAVFFVASDS